MNQNNLNAKIATVEEITAKAQKSQAVIIVEYRGLSVGEITNLRRSLREVNAEMVVYKNSLVERAVDQLKHEELHQFLEGPNAFIFSDDVIAGPKVVAKHARLNDKIVIKGALVEGRVVDADSVKAIAKLPGRDGLISMFLSVLQAPIRQFAATVKAAAEAKN